MNTAPEFSDFPSDEHARDASSGVEMSMGIIRHVDNTEHRLLVHMSDISQRLDATATEIRDAHANDLRYLNDRINTVEKNLTDKLDTQTKDIDKNIGEHFKHLGTKMDQNFSKLDKRITVLERWQWLIVGGSIVVLFLLSNYIIEHFDLIQRSPRIR